MAGIELQHAVRGKVIFFTAGKNDTFAVYFSRLHGIRLLMYENAILSARKEKNSAQGSSPLCVTSEVRGAPECTIPPPDTCGCNIFPITGSPMGCATQGRTQTNIPHFVYLKMVAYANVTAVFSTTFSPAGV